MNDKQPRPCERCGQPAAPDSRGRPRRFCSEECRAAHRAKRMRGNRNAMGKRTFRTFTPPAANPHPYAVEHLRGLAETYWGDRGRVMYDTFAWANKKLFDGTVAVPLIQLTMTGMYGVCVGWTKPCDTTRPIITIYEWAWNRYGDAYMVDTIIHETLHVWAQMLAYERRRVWWRTSHRNAIWIPETQRLSDALGIDFPRAFKRARGRGMSEDQIYAEWPHGLRPSGYYKQPVKTKP